MKNDKKRSAVTNFEFDFTHWSNDDLLRCYYDCISKSAECLNPDEFQPSASKAYIEDANEYYQEIKNRGLKVHLLAQSVSNA
jgi:hypothetical protein